MIMAALINSIVIVEKESGICWQRLGKYVVKKSPRGKAREVIRGWCLKSRNKKT